MGIAVNMVGSLKSMMIGAAFLSFVEVAVSSSPGACGWIPTAGVCYPDTGAPCCYHDDCSVSGSLNMLKCLHGRSQCLAVPAPRGGFNVASHVGQCKDIVKAF